MKRDISFPVVMIHVFIVCIIVLENLTCRILRRVILEKEVSIGQVENR